MIGLINKVLKYIFMPEPPKMFIVELRTEWYFQAIENKVMFETNSRVDAIRVAYKLNCYILSGMFKPYFIARLFANRP